MTAVAPISSATPPPSGEEPFVLEIFGYAIPVSGGDEIVNNRKGGHFLTVRDNETTNDHAFRMPRESLEPREALRRRRSSSSSLLRLPPSPPNDEALVRSGWPWSGEVEFDDVSARHNPGSPRVLKGVTVRALPGSTLGVVGRTGSGKSLLLSTLFRILEIEKR